jgi:glycosyltransferase involved in cell wall biosynthesis
VIPCYNYGHLVGAAIDSALAQIPAPHEVLVVDDGSKDNTRAVVEAYGAPVRYVPLGHGGVSAARNAGAALVSGDFVVFLDADDLLEPGYFSACHAALSRSPANVAYAYTPVRYFGRQHGTSKASPFSLRTLRYGNYINVSAMLRREALSEARFRNDLPGLEDFDFFLTLAEHGRSGVRVNKALVRYRKHESSSDRLADQWATLFDNVMDMHPDLYPRHVRRTIRAFSVLGSVPVLGRVIWAIRHLTREGVAKAAANG